MRQTPNLSDYLLLVFISFVWGSSFMAIKIGLETFSPFSLAACRVFIAGAFLYSVSRLRGEIFPTDKATLKQLAIMGLFGSGAFILISWGQQYIPSSVAGIMLAFGPLNVLLLAHFMTADEKITAKKMVGFLFGFLGVVALFATSGVPGAETDVKGLLALFIATLCYALSMIFVRRLPGVSSINVATGFLIMAALVAVPVSFIFDPPWAHQLTLRGSLAILFLGLMSTGLSSILLIVLVKRVGATFSSYSNYLTPLVAVMWGALFLDEPLAPATWMALALILSGVAISNLPRPKKRLL